MAKFISQEMREQSGQYSRVTDRLMIILGIERIGNCEACGHKIKLHCGVKSPDGIYMWVGGCCAGILCAPDKTDDILPGTQYKIGDKEYILPNTEWVEKLELITYGKSYKQACIDSSKSAFGSGGIWYSDQFYMSILHSLREYGQLTIKQYETVNKSLNK